MKQMTKAIAILMIAVLMLGLASCTLFKNYDYVNEAITKTAGVNALDMEMKTDIKVTAGETNEDLSYVYNVKMKDLQTNEPDFLTDVDVTLFGETVPATVYYEDTYFYVVTEMENVKLASGDLISKYDFANEWKTKNALIPEDVLKNAEETVNTDGTKTVALSYEAEPFKAAYGNLITEWQGKLLTKYVGETVESSLTPSNMIVTVVIDETTGYLTSYTISFDADMTAKTTDDETKSLSANITYQTVYNAVEDAVVLNAPEGYADFEETDGLPLSAYEMMRDSVKEALALKDFEAEVQMKIALSMSGMNMEIPTKYVFSVKNAMTDDEEFQSTMTASLLGTEIRQHTYYKGGFYYITDEINKLKFEKNDETHNKYGYRGNVEYILKAFPEAMLEDVEVQRNADGTKTATFTLDSSLLIRRYFTEIINTVDAMDLGEIKWKTADITLVWNKDKTLKSYTIDAKADTVINKNTTEMSLMYVIDFKSTENITPAVPEDLDEYMTMAELNGVVFDIVNNAIKGVWDANDISVQASQYVDMEMEDTYIGIEQYYTIVANKLQTTSPVYRYILESSLNGIEIEEDVYYENGYFYINSNALEQPCKVREADAPSYSALASISKVIKMIPESALEKVKIEGSQGAVCKLYWEMEPSEFKTVFPELADVSVTGYQVGNVICREAAVYIVTDVNGKLLTYDLYADLSVTIAEPGASAKIDYYMEVYYDFDTSGATVIITPPENYQNYSLLMG